MVKARITRRIFRKLTLISLRIRGALVALQPPPSGLSSSSALPDPSGRSTEDPIDLDAVEDSRDLTPASPYDKNRLPLKEIHNTNDYLEPSSNQQHRPT